MTCFSPEWFSEFFESPDSIPLSFFPTPGETDREVAALEELLELPREGRIADLCCGAGRHVLRLLERGYRAVGLDLSAMMLGLARQEARRRGTPAPFVRGDARRLPFPDACLDVALNLFNSFGYCESDEENEQVLRETARVLRPGGQFFLETRNPQYQILFAPVRQEVKTADGSKLVVGWRYDRETKRLNSTWRRPRIDRVVYRASIRLYQLEELRGMMERVGLEETGVFGGYGGEAFDGWERLVIWRGRKKFRVKG
jgi:ubiquinone/menaquinone biosynthesis C-methylase UbiE